jgi:tetratricopeptide (TPR) repeat protein
MAIGDQSDSLISFRRALALVERAHGAGHPGVATALLCLAEAELEHGDHAAALAHFRRGLAMDEQFLAADSRTRAGLQIGLGEALLVRGEVAAAIEALEPVLAHPGLREDPGALAGARFALARALWGRAGERGRAMALVQEAAAGLRQARAGRELGELEGWLARVKRGK